MEAIVSILNKAGFVESQRGKDGGYRLTRAPEGYTIGSILKLTEGSLAPISCSEMGSGGSACWKSLKPTGFRWWRMMLPLNWCTME
jgi:DNA-binding IscR family transcriptional regulator